MGTSMGHYINITLLPDPEFPVTTLMNSLFSKFHKGLYDQKATDIGVSFPQCQAGKKQLGNVLRLHGNADSLSAFMAVNWIGPMSGYCQVSEVQKQPDQVQYRTISRRQAPMSAAKLKRLKKRGHVTEQGLKDYQSKLAAQPEPNQPYLELKSASNGQRYRRYIEIGPLQDQPNQGEFDQFGLSRTATVAWF